MKKRNWKKILAEIPEDERARVQKDHVVAPGGGHIQPTEPTIEQLIELLKPFAAAWHPSLGEQIGIYGEDGARIVLVYPGDVSSRTMHVVRFVDLKRAHKALANVNLSGSQPKETT